MNLTLTLHLHLLVRYSILTAFSKCRQFSLNKRTLQLRSRRVESPLRNDGNTPLRTVERFMALSCKLGSGVDGGNDAEEC